MNSAAGENKISEKDKRRAKYGSILSFFLARYLITNFLILKAIKIIAHISIRAIIMTGIPFIIVLIELNLIFLTK